MDINDTVKEVYESAVAKGLWDNLNQKDFYDWLRYEVKEAYEEMIVGNTRSFKKGGIPVGEQVELVDCVLLIMSYFGHKGWDLESVLKTKIEYNKTREYGHGEG